MNILFVALGSAGDVYPSIGIGKELRARGHRVTIITNNACEKVVRSEGLEYVRLNKELAQPEPIGVNDLLRGQRWQELLDRRLVRPVLRTFFRSWRKLARSSTVLPYLRPAYRAIAERANQRDSVVVAGPLAFGARIAHERLGIPLATVHLSPASLPSVIRPPVLPAWRLPPCWPTWAKRQVVAMRDVCIIDRLLCGPVNAFRAEIGLKPVDQLFTGWRDSPQRILGLFPDWFAPSPGDWPPALRLTGFIPYEESVSQAPPKYLQEFLDRGEPPIVFTAGSAFRRERQFFEEAVGACQLLGRRGLLLTRFAELVPSHLPDGVRHCSFVPLGQLLPRAAAIVSYGGIGTAARALAAGIPQVVTPHKHDQPENAARLTELGVARTIAPTKFRAKTVANDLDHLLRSPSVAVVCRELSHRLLLQDAVGETCRLVEGLASAAHAKAA